MNMPSGPRITGSVFDIVHPNYREASYWRDPVLAYSAEDWRRFMLHMRESGLDTLVLLGAMATGKPLFPGHPFLREHYFDDARDRIREGLEGAAEAGLAIFLPLGHQEKYNHEIIHSDAAVGRTLALAETFLQRYGALPSFHGWYIADEFGFDRHGAFNSDPVKYTAGVSRGLRRLSPDRPRMTSPYFHPGCGLPDTAQLSAQLAEIGVDILCVQDGANNREITPEYFHRIRDACAGSGTHLWANIELFNWENGSIYDKTPLIPADFEDIAARIARFSPFADKLLCYQFMGLMNNLGLGKQPDATGLWQKYMDAYVRPR
jgi:hypothetical protein